jgi:DNA-binding NarL/FixJ family response regulator
MFEISAITKNPVFAFRRPERENVRPVIVRLWEGGIVNLLDSAAVLLQDTRRQWIAAETAHLLRTRPVHDFASCILVYGEHQERVDPRNVSALFGGYCDLRNDFNRSIILQWTPTTIYFHVSPLRFDFPQIELLTKLECNLIQSFGFSFVTPEIGWYLISVIIISDNRFSRESLGELIKKKRDLRLLSAAEFSPSMVERTVKSDPDVVILTPSWHDVEFQATRVIHDAAPRAKIMMIGMEDNRDTFLKSVRAGAVGYLLKQASAEQIITAVSELAKDTFLCPDHMVRALFDFTATNSSRTTNSTNGNGGSELTRRENQLISILAQGLTNKEIAAQLNLSEHTVKNHVHSILRKTGARTRGGLAHLQSSPGVWKRLPSASPRIN